MIKIIIVVVRPKDTVLVKIMKDENTNKYCFVNLTKNHICRCRFNSYEEAMNDLKEQQNIGKVIHYYEILQDI